MARTPKLDDLQLILLSTAAQRVDGSLLPSPGSVGDQAERIAKALPPLIKRALVEEVAVADAERAWRNDGDRRIGVIITAAGRAIIAAQDTLGEQRTDTPPVLSEAVAPVSSTSKIAYVIELLKREQGATLDEMIAETNWLPHTTRAALTGLRKKGHALDKRKRGEITCYHIVVVA